MKENLIVLDERVAKGSHQAVGQDSALRGAPWAPHSALATRQAAFGYTSEELVVVLRPMVTEGKEPIGSMGDDTPPAALSQLPRPLFHYFRQRFAEVTNPPIDPLREEMVMSLRMLLGQRANLLSELPEATRLIELTSPILQPEEINTLRSLPEPEFRAVTVESTWEKPDDLASADAGATLRAALEKLCFTAETAVRGGAHILIISDAKADQHTLPIPSLLAVGAVHHHLISQGLRMAASLVCESGEPRDVHQFAALIGYGANAVYPYLVYAAIEEMVAENRHTAGMTVAQANHNFVKAVDKGLLKVMSKMGISTLDSYCGGQIFEAVGIDSRVIGRYFTGTSSRIGGLTLVEIAEEACRRHQQGFGSTTATNVFDLDVGGDYQWRRLGERHLNNQIGRASCRERV